MCGAGRGSLFGAAGWVMATASRCPLSPHPARVEKKQQPGEKRQTPAKNIPGPPQQVRGSRDPGFVVPGACQGCPGQCWVPAGAPARVQVGRAL